jgi:hypothetical protein
MPCAAALNRPVTIRKNSRTMLGFAALNTNLLLWLQRVGWAEEPATKPNKVAPLMLGGGAHGTPYSAWPPLPRLRNSTGVSPTQRLKAR